MDNIKFQEKAINELLSWLKRLWRNDAYMQEITFKAPTGSGKTYMTERFICELTHQPDWQQDVAFVWITFSDDLAMQSRDKFIEYFAPNIPGRLLTINDFSQGRLGRNDVLFLNWQKLVSRRAEDRVNRRPDDPRMLKEQGYYYEDIVEQTHREGREIVLIIDESHEHVTESAQRDVIDPMNPKVIIRVSATPTQIPSYSDVTHGKAGFVEVDQQDVIDEGLIKSEIVCQTEEDLRKHQGEDLDEALVKMGMEKREELLTQLQKAGIDVNPLVLIQLPNDDAEYAKNGAPTKEDIVKGFLIRNGVKPENIALWFDQKKKPDSIEDNNSPYEYLLFKMAAGTGWDCPRAQILVMFREIKSAVFHTQTIGRIMRVPVRGVPGSDIFRTGYLYTNYKRNEVVYGTQDAANKPKLFLAENTKGKDFVIDEKMCSEYIPRVDYGDLGRADKFQKCLVSAFNAYFGLTDDDLLDQRMDKLRNMGLTLNPHLTREIIVNAKFRNIDQLATDLMKSADAHVEISRNDVEKTFTLLCTQLLLEITDPDIKVSNIARSWSLLKSALRLWLKQALPGQSEDLCYRIFVKDIETGEHSRFRRALIQALTAYKPILEEQKKLRQKQAEDAETQPFTVKRIYAYTDDYEAMDMERCLFKPFYIRKAYSGRLTELKFAKFLDTWEKVDWWMKNGDSGKDLFSIRYMSRQDSQQHLFYPDWIVRYKDGTIGIYDTKGGITATSPDTHDKANELQQRILQWNSIGRRKYVGGIVVETNGLWMVSNGMPYQSGITEANGWHIMD